MSCHLKVHFWRIFPAIFFFIGIFIGLHLFGCQSTTTTQDRPIEAGKVIRTTDEGKPCYWAYSLNREVCVK